MEQDKLLNGDYKGEASVFLSSKSMVVWDAMNLMLIKLFEFLPIYISKDTTQLIGGSKMCNM